MATPAPVRVFEWNLTVFRRVWRTSLFASIVQPLLFLIGMGLGVGGLVDENAGSEASLGGVSYQAFLGPALIATTAMMVASIEATWPVMDAMKWRRVYHAMSATPIGTNDLVSGFLLWSALRCFLACTGVAIALAVFPDTRTWGLIPAVAFGVLCGLAFALPTAAFAATQDRDVSFATYQRFVIIPLFLFGGAFYPISALPEILQVIARVTPLWHGVELCRGAVLETLTLAEVIVHAGYLTIWVVAGVLAAQVTYARRLRP
jgi:lipooligosaccharide transport system permease protein